MTYRHWEADFTMPSAEVALASPLSEWNSWWFRMECSCGRERWANQVHLLLERRAKPDTLLRDLAPRIRHRDCDGRPVLVELLTGIPSVQNGVQRLVLISWTEGVNRAE